MKALHTADDDDDEHDDEEDDEDDDDNMMMTPVPKPRGSSSYESSSHLHHLFSQSLSGR